MRSTQQTRIRWWNPFIESLERKTKPVSISTLNYSFSMPEKYSTVKWKSWFTYHGSKVISKMGNWLSHSSRGQAQSGDAMAYHCSQKVQQGSSQPENLSSHQFHRTPFWRMYVSIRSRVTKATSHNKLLQSQLKHFAIDSHTARMLHR